MNKKEAIKKLIRTKVYTNGRSEEIQKKLFELDFNWYGSAGKIAINLKEPFIFINEDNYLDSSADMEHFIKSSFKEISIEDIISIKIDKEYNFEPFDKVLVRNNNNEYWIANFYSHTAINEMYKYKTINDYNWKKCIPYEGNEDLIGTTKIPK